MKVSALIKLTLASAVLASGAAHAAVSLPDSGNGDLWLYVKDTTTQLTYARDLGIGTQAIATQGVVQGAGATAGTVSSAISYSLPTISADGTLSSYLNSHTGDNFIWAIMGGSGAAGVQTNVADQIFISTTDPTNAIATSFTNPNNGNVNNMTGLQGSQSAESGLLINDATHSNSTNFQSDSSLWLQAGGANMNVWYNSASKVNNQVGGTATGAAQGLGTAADFYLIANNGKSSLAKALVFQLSNVTLNFDGSLTSAAAPAVPLPAAFWLFGSGLLGLVGVGRRRAA